MSVLKFTLIGDGSSDKTLLQIIKWTLDDLFPQLPNEGSFADFRSLPSPPKAGEIANQIKSALHYYPCDILFYHRDAEAKDRDIIKKRKLEILNGFPQTPKPLVCIVPIVMMEAWLLIDETAIKKASGNRNFKGPINLPSLKALENENDPKELLHRLLREACGLKGRSLSKFNVHSAVHLVAENISDFSSLRQLEAFKIFEKDLRESVTTFLEKS